MASGFSEPGTAWPSAAASATAASFSPAWAVTDTGISVRMSVDPSAGLLVSGTGVATGWVAASAAGATAPTDAAANAATAARPSALPAMLPAILPAMLW